LSIKSFTGRLLEAFPYEPTKGQLALSEKLSHFLSDHDPKSVFILRGYAGTGKTSFISALVKILPSMRIKPVLLAPTGRAAKVFSGYSGQPAQTIHRRIYFQQRAKDGSIFLAMQNNLFKDAMFIVDEASMIAGKFQESDRAFRSRNLLDDLLEYVSQGQNCRLMMIGDTAQLPPVGLNISPALDLEFLKTRYNLKLYSYELTEVMRQAKDSGILLNATRLRNMLNNQKTSSPLIEFEGQSDVLKINNIDLEDELNRAFPRDSLGQAVIVCRSNKRANLFNQEIRKRVLFQEDMMNAGDILMVVKNNYFWLDPKSVPGFIANGDMVEVVRIQRTEEEYGFQFADVTIRMMDYPEDPMLDVKVLLDTITSESPSLTIDEQDKLFHAVMEEYQDIPNRISRFEKVRTNPYFNALQVKFAYAMTCHKTQGGQWQDVFIDRIIFKEKKMDSETLRWFYTALTRATRRVYLIDYDEKILSAGP
jgi:exodeoxyribonuclease-5